MIARFLKIGGFLCLFGFGFSFNALAEDPPKPAAEPSTSSGSNPPPDKTTGSVTYITVGNVVGEILKVDSTSMTLRVQKPKAPPPGPIYAANKKQYEQQLKLLKRLEQKEAKNAKKSPNYIDYTFEFAVDAQARIQHLPPKTDENGKTVPYTAEEVRQLKGNPDIPGWKSDLTALKVKETVEAHIVVLPVKAANGFGKEDMIVRWALVLNEPHKSATSGTSADPATTKKTNN